MDERATENALDEPRPGASDTPAGREAIEARPVAVSDGVGDAAGQARSIPPPLPAGGSSVHRHGAVSGNGSSRTRTFAAVSSEDAIISRDIAGGSTSRRMSRAVARVDTQPTVISKQAPAALTPAMGNLHPLEMGRVLQGQTLGHYELIEFVGGGGMGAVFRALDTMLNRTVAVKVLSHDQSNDEETLRRFKNEAQSAARLDHENIGRVHYVGEDGGWHYIVFEFIEGINLRDLVERDGRLPLADTVSYMLQLGDALAHASRRDVVHRDIKPSNVLITPEGKAKLVDMGLARLHQVEHANNDLTASGVTLGTFDYISPEQARDPRSADVRSDLYSLGCTFYFMLTARPPFPEGTVLQKLLMHQADDPPDPRKFCPELPDDLHRILKRLLSKSPDDRYQRPQELVADLTAAAVRLGLRPASPGSMVWLATAPASTRQWQRVVPWLAPIAALVAIVLLLNAIWSPPDDITPNLLKRSRGESRLANDTSPKGAATTENGASQRNLAHAADPTTARAAADAPQEISPPPRAGVMPWIDSTVPGYKQVATRMWDTVHSEDFVSRWTAARQSLRLPFEIDLRDQQNDAAAAPRTPAPGERIVAGRGAARSQYASLAAALREAKTGDVIVLRFNGPLVEPALDVGNLRLTIRAERDYAPVIQFVPGDDDLLAERRSMFNIDGGSLALQDIHIDFTLPADNGDHWSLFEIGHAESLRFDGCTATLRNTDEGFDHATASFVHVRAGLADGTGMMKDAQPAARAVQIETHNSIFRGEATFLTIARARGVEWTAENALFVLGERLIDADVGLMSNRSVSTTSVDLRHATVLAQAGMLRLNNEARTSSVMHVDVQCRDSILTGGREPAAGIAPMIEQIGDEAAETLRRQLSWQSERSLLDGFAIAWRAQTAAGAPHDLGLAQFRSFFGIRDNSITAPLRWARLPASGGRPVHDYRPADFTLTLGSGGIGEATDGADIGADLAALPLLPRQGDSSRD